MPAWAALGFDLILHNSSFILYPSLPASLLANAFGVGSIAWLDGLCSMF
jgi:hypothetical protein